MPTPRKSNETKPFTIELGRYKPSPHRIKPTLARQLIRNRSSRLSEDAVEKMIKVVNRIIEEPRRLDMMQWGTVNAKYSKRHKPKDGVPSCGTIGCFAGWTLVLFTPKEELREIFADEADACAIPANKLASTSLGFPEDTDEKAAELLGLDMDDAFKLFMPNGSEASPAFGTWPWVFWKEYQEAKTPLERALATKKRVIHFILEGK